MIHLFPEEEPHAHGLLDVGGGNQIYWECCGNPAGKPVVVLHGGPGLGMLFLASETVRSKSLPHCAFRSTQLRSQSSEMLACARGVNLALNTTAHLVADIETLRLFLNIEKWLVLGGSWGSVLSLAYAETHPEFVSEMILFGVTAGRKKEFDWLFRGGVNILFPRNGKG